MSATSATESVHLWRCTHPLCQRAVQDCDVDYLRFMGQHTQDEDRIAQAGMVLFDKRQPDAAPKCVGGPLGRAHGGGWHSHRAAPMELVEYEPMAQEAINDAHK